MPTARRPEPQGERAADDRHRLAAESIGRVEGAPVGDLDAQGVEVRGAHGHEARTRRQRALRVVSHAALRRLLQRPRARERDAARPLDARGAFRDTLVDGRAAGRIGVRRLAQADATDDHVVRVDAHFDAEDAQAAAHHQR
ncbi:MAG: hypothetical protein M3R55_12905, partial [Acidobacteriota bacterium]|nr:hypothetical protein [Acidobacteriota bacterium]